MLSLESHKLLLPESSRTAMRDAFQLAAEQFSRLETSAYPEPSGLANLRGAIRDVTPHWSGDVLVTNSATEALYLALRVVSIQKGKKLALQVPCYFGVIRQAKDLGMEILTFETLDELEKLESFDGLLLTSNFTPPHGRSLSKTDKQRIATLAHEYDAFVIEDNPYDIVWFDHPPMAIPTDSHRAIRIGSLSKVASPDFRLGFVKAEGDLLRALRSQKITINLSSPTALQNVASAALQPAILDQLRQELRQRAYTLKDEIESRLGIAISQPEGGNYICMPLPEQIVVGAFIKACADRGLALDNNAHYYPDGLTRPYIRLHMGAISLDNMPTAVRIMEQVIAEMSPISPPQDVRGKRILITGGTTKEVIDGVRHYANYSRPADQGLRLADTLAAMGARVTLITTKTKNVSEIVDVISTRVDGRPIVSATDMAGRCKQELQTASFDLAIHLANTASLRAAQVTEQKLKVKTKPGEPVFMDVIPNTDVLATLRQILPAVGYNPNQLLEASPLWRELINQHIHHDRIVTETPRLPAAQRTQPLTGRKIIITSGPTVENLTTAGDTISNFSSGRQGHEIACALADYGATVILVSGPTTLSDPIHQNIRTIHVASAQSMLDACAASLPADGFVGVAAVADFGIKHPIEPLKQTSGSIRIELSQNPDILQTMGTHPIMRPTVVVGFAAETNDLETYARGKLEKKNADVIFANLVGSAMIQRGSDRNHVYRVTREETHDCGESDKYEVGISIAKFMAGRFGVSPTPVIIETPEGPA